MSNNDSVLQYIVCSKPITTDDKQELISTILTMIEDLVLGDPMLYAKYNYRERIIDSITEMFIIQINGMISSSDIGYKMDDAIAEGITPIIEEALYVYHLFFSPKREYGNTFIRKRPNRSKISKQIEFLSNVPQPDQRTDEWYMFRHKYLTASSIWKVFSTPGARNQLIYDKCKPLDTNKYKGVCTSSPMHWGNKYEPVSILWYEKTFTTKISDFGCIPHNTIGHVAASPDGINTCSHSDRYGRMLEVKNIVNRDITGIPKSEYWIQMQLQMEVCELNECDFLETRFTEYDTEEEFRDDGTFQKTQDDKHKGIILYFMEDGKPLYEYAPFMCTQEEFTIWESTIMAKNVNLTWVQTIYWKLQEISCVLVLRNKTWFRGAVPVLEEFWEIIQREKKTDYTHRAPKKRIKPGVTIELSPPKCMINIAALTLPLVKTQGAATPCPDQKSPKEKVPTKEKAKPTTINITTQSLYHSQYLDDS